MFSIETTIVLTRDESVLKEYLPEVISVLVSFSTGFSGLLTLIFIVPGEYVSCFLPSVIKYEYSFERFGIDLDESTALNSTPIVFP